ncbi:MAG: DUF2029 domain-containing protein [Cyanobacteria bacterium SZAS-4]|nr:DUF2029 domain-containing protein [Cyanobacteria bacterium SZAS-4]
MNGSESAPRKPDKLEIALPYCFSLLLLVVVGVLLSAPHLALKDMPEFYAPGRLMFSGTIADVYKPEVYQPLVRQLFPDHEAPILYIPPYGLPLLLPLGCFPPALADYAWFAFLILCSFGSVVVLKLTLKLQHKYVMRIAGLLCLSGPEWEAIRNGQLAPILLLSLCGGLFFFKRDLAQSASAKLIGKFKDNDIFAALALTPLLTKPQLAIPVLVYLLGAGQYQVLLFVIAFGVVLNAVALIMFGSNTYAAYFALLQRVQENRVWQVPEVTPTIRGQLLRFFPTADSAVMLVSGVALCVGMICVFLIARKYRKSSTWWEYLALGAIPTGLLTALHCHNYDLLLLLPSIVVFMFGASTAAISNKRKLLWLLPLVPLMMPVYNKVHYEYLLVGGSVNLLFLDLAVVAVASIVWLLLRRD